MTDSVRDALDASLKTLDPQGKSTNDIIEYLKAKARCSQHEVISYLQEGDRLVKPRR